MTSTPSLFGKAEARKLAPVPIRIVVLGGGFAGAYTAKYLGQLLGKRQDVEVELLSENNYLVFQPLLPEVAAGGVAAAHIVNPVREMVPRARFRCCSIHSVDSAAKRVWVSQGDGLEPVAVPYDHLVLGLGKVTHFGSMPGVAEHGFAMKDLADAFKLRNHVIRCLELADIETDPALKQALLTFVVAGGGFSGVETVGELSELVHRSLKYFPRITKSEVHFKLVHSQERILPEMPPALGASARRILERRGVEMQLNARVRAASKHAVFLASGLAIATRTFVCTVGTAPNPVNASLLATGRFERAQLAGKSIDAFATDTSLRCIGNPGHWAVGDCAGIPNPTGNGLCPPTAQFAIREAKLCAENIVRSINGEQAKPFRFKVLGALASLGQRSAVAQIFGVELSGFFAWFLWRTIYLAKLPGLVRRLRVTLDWTLDLFFPRDITQLPMYDAKQFNLHHYEPGEVIVREGQVGREYYLIVRGKVDVLTAGNNRVLTQLGPDEGFGERALLEDTRRNATVRATEAVDVLVMSRTDFSAMSQHFPVLREHFAKLLRERVSGPALQPELAARKVS